MLVLIYLSAFTSTSTYYCVIGRVVTKEIWRGKFFNDDFEVNLRLLFSRILKNRMIVYDEADEPEVVEMQESKRRTLR